MIAEPLNALKKKGAIFQWINESQTAFQCLKDHLTSPSILSHPDIYRCVHKCKFHWAGGNLVSAVKHFLERRGHCLWQPLSDKGRAKLLHHRTRVSGSGMESGEMETLSRRKTFHGCHRPLFVAVGF